MITLKKSAWALAAGLMVHATAFAQQSTLHGLVSDTTIKEAELFQMQDGRHKQIAMVKIPTDGKFDLSFTPSKEGLYFLSYGVKKQRQVFKFYFKPGDEAQAVFYKQHYELKGKNTKENKALAAFNALNEELDTLDTWALRNKPEPVFAAVESVAGKLAKRTPKSTGNKTFDALLPAIQEMEFAHTAIGFMLMPRNKVFTNADLSPWYLTFNPDTHLRNTTILQLPYADQLITELLFFKTRNNNAVRTFEDRILQIPNDTLKGQVVLNRLYGTKGYVQFMELRERYMAYFTPAHQEITNNLVKNLDDTKPGKPAIDFSFEDINGEKHALHDFKGKLVLVDFWATWCAPCKAEEPYWVKLNEQFAGKDIVFVGISVDKNKEAWEKYIRGKSPKGLHLWGGNNMEVLTKEYTITGIPRYLLIDRDGKMITVEAPKPSDPSLARILENWLQQAPRS